MMVHHTKKSSLKINLLLTLLMNVSKIFQIVGPVINHVRRGSIRQLGILFDINFSSVSELLFEYNAISTPTQ